MEHFATFAGELEVRARGAGRILRGSFPYGRMATVRDRGRVRKERIGGDAFGWQVRRFEELQQQLADVVDAAQRQVIEEMLERANVHVLAGHDFGKALGDRVRGTARVASTRESLDFEVDLPPTERMPSYMRDAVLDVEDGRAGGLSPGFRVPPPNVVPDAERLVDEPGNPGVQIREVRQAVLYEISIVSRPAYAGTDVDVRAEDVAPAPARQRVSLLWP